MYTRELFGTTCFIPVHAREAVRSEASHWQTDNSVFSLSASGEHNKLYYWDRDDLPSRISSTLIHSRSCPPRRTSGYNDKEETTRPPVSSIFHRFVRPSLLVPPQTRGKCMIRPLVELNRYFSCDKWNCFACGACHARGRSASLRGASSEFLLPDRFETSLGIKWDRKNVSALRSIESFRITRRYLNCAKRNRVRFINVALLNAYIRSYNIERFTGDNLEIDRSIILISISLHILFISKYQDMK